MKKYFLYIMALFYMGAGINHFLNSKVYISIMPDFISWKMTFVYISGILELIFGFLLCFQKTRAIAAGLIIILLILIFPANIQMAINYAKQGNPNLWIAIARLPIQILLIWWAWIYTKNEKEFR